MVYHHLNWRLGSSSLAVLTAIVFSSHVALATNYTFNTVAAASANWHDTTKWTPTGIPNAVGDVATFVMPATTAPGANGFTLTLQGNDTTVGSLVIDETNHTNGYVTRLNSSGGKLIFQNTSGAATLTETAGTPNLTNNGRFVINQPVVQLKSDFVVTSDNQPNLNTALEIGTRIDGASNITFTKNGSANLQLSSDVTSFGTGEGFEGQYVVNGGGIRLIGREPIIKAAGFTVNAGGQLQLSTITNWNMAGGAVLNLNGTGKASGTSADGALRIQTNGTVFSNPVSLQSDASVHIPQSTVTATLDQPVSGVGDLIKTGPGTLILSSSGNNYTGDTKIQNIGAVLGGTLSISNANLADAADVYLTTGSIFDLTFLGADTIRSLYIDGVAQATGIWGATSSGADHESALITGSGRLNVTTLPVVGLPGDFNSDGKVDAADYATWRKNDAANATLPNDNGVGTQAARYSLWRGNFGNGAPGSGSSLSGSAVPEPTTMVLLISIVPLIAGGRHARKRA
jgi:autotransporter-associated beta strand protein